MVESLLFIEAGAGARVGAETGEKNTRGRSRLKTDRLRNTACNYLIRPHVRSLAFSFYL